jgi:gluconokinase
MGVLGSGKTTTGQQLAARLAMPFTDADDFHPQVNIAKMAAGIPLDDRDRQPWLNSVVAWLTERRRAGTGGVLACSALKRRYRDAFRSAAPELFFLHLTTDRSLLVRRLDSRRDHFAGAALLDSQLCALEPLQPDEPGAVLPTDRPSGAVVDAAVSLLESAGVVTDAGR